MGKTGKKKSGNNVKLVTETPQVNPEQQMQQGDFKASENYKLDAIDLAMLKYICEYPAITNSALAELVGLEDHAVGKRKKKEAFQKALEQYFMPARKRLEVEVDSSVRKFLSLRHDENSAVALKAVTMHLVSEGVLKERSEVEVQLPKPIVVKIGPERIVMGVEPAVQAVIDKERDVN